MASYPPPPPPYQPNPNDPNAWKYQRRILRDQAKAQRRMARAQSDYYRNRFRRRSMVGPLLLIAVGVVVLLVQTGHLQAYRLWEWEASWWPLLLVGIGLLLLAEWVFDQTFHREGDIPYVRRGIGGGVVFLLIVLAAGGALFHSLREGGHNFFAHGLHIGPDNIDEIFGDRHDSDQMLNQAFPANTSLAVSNPHGDVTVSGTSSDGQLHLTLHKQVYVHSNSEADSKAQSLQPQITNSGGILSVSLPSMEGAHADMVLTIPASTPVTINASHGDISVTTLKAPVTVSSDHGDVELSAITGNVEARISNSGSSFSAHNITGSVTVHGRSGDVTASDIAGPLTLDGEFFGSTHLEHINGAVHFHTSRTDLQLARLDGEIDIGNGSGLSVDQALGPFNLTTRNRNITLERVAGDVTVANSNGTVDLSSPMPLGNINVENRSGDVKLTLPEHANFHYQATTNDGDLESDFSSIQRDDSRHQNTASGIIGTGGPTVRLSTSHGDIALRKDNVAPLPPKAPAPPASPHEDFTVKDQDSSVTISKDGVRIIDGEGGNRVIIGKDGVRITKGPDGSKVIVGKDGTTRFTSNPDGTVVYVGKDGSRLTRNSDGSKVYVFGDGTRLTIEADRTTVYSGKDGSRITKNSDGSKVFLGKDGSRITINADGTKFATGPDGKPLSDSAIRDRLHNVDEDIRRAAEKGDSELRSQSTNSN
jgi:DUF4097 and DUF4098 domain-containing protein YvlB